LRASWAFLRQIGFAERHQGGRNTLGLPMARRTESACSSDDTASASYPGGSAPRHIAPGRRGVFVVVENLPDVEGLPVVVQGALQLHHF